MLLRPITMKFPEGEDYQVIISNISRDMMRHGLHPSVAKEFREQAHKAIRGELIRVAGEWVSVIE